LSAALNYGPKLHGLQPIVADWSENITVLLQPIQKGCAQIGNIRSTENTLRDLRFALICQPVSVLAGEFFEFPCYGQLVQYLAEIGFSAHGNTIPSTTLSAGMPTLLRMMPIAMMKMKAKARSVVMIWPLFFRLVVCRLAVVLASVSPADTSCRGVADGESWSR